MQVHTSMQRAKFNILKQGIVPSDGEVYKSTQGVD